GLAGYLFLGAWLQRVRYAIRARGKNYVGSLLLFVLASVVTMLATSWLSSEQGEPSTEFYDYLSPFVIIAAAGSYLFLAWSADRLFRWEGGDKLRKGVLSLSALTLGIYCIHISWLDWLMDHVDWQRYGTSAWWMMPGIALLLFALSGVSVALMRQVRVLRYVI